jgi:hypothetical protein
MGSTLDINFAVLGDTVFWNFTRDGWSIEKLALNPKYWIIA